MRRARHPVSPELRELTYNLKSALYEIEECGIVYGIPLEHTRLLKAFSRAWTFTGEELLVASWYKSLDKAQKRQIKRVGNVPIQSTGFYPDPEFD